MRKIISLSMLHDDATRATTTKRRTYSYCPADFRILGKGIAIGLAVGSIAMMWIMLGVMG